MEICFINDQNLNENLLPSEGDMIDERAESNKLESKLRVIGYQISIIRDESYKFLISEFKLVIIFGIILSLSLLVVKGFDYKSFLIINFLYGIIVSLICAYISCTMGINECEMVIINSEYYHT